MSALDTNEGQRAASLAYAERRYARQVTEARAELERALDRHDALVAAAAADRWGTIVGANRRYQELVAEPEPDNERAA